MRSEVEEAFLLEEGSLRVKSKSVLTVFGRLLAVDQILAIIS